MQNFLVHEHSQAYQHIISFWRKSKSLQERNVNLSLNKQESVDVFILVALRSLVYSKLKYV